MQSTDFEWLWHCQWKFVNCNTCTTLWGCWQWGKLCICWGRECRKSLPSSQFCREPKTPLKNSLHKNQYTLLNKGNKEIKLVRDHQKVQSVKERLELYWDFLPDEIRMERTLEKFRFGEKQQLFGHKYSSWGNLWIRNLALSLPLLSPSTRRVGKRAVGLAAWGPGPHAPALQLMNSENWSQNTCHITLTGLLCWWSNELMCGRSSLIWLNV